ncbi:MAG: hypothetical protein KF703_08615, partial [Actinobacteria bacterium]|nr:hypothetical protein [Actinomycetota bacterium]
MAETADRGVGGAALARAEAAIDDLFATGIDPVDADDARALIVAVEHLARRVRAGACQMVCVG